MRVAMTFSAVAVLVLVAMRMRVQGVGYMRVGYMQAAADKGAQLDAAAPAVADTRLPKSPRVDGERVRLVGSRRRNVGLEARVIVIRCAPNLGLARPRPVGGELGKHPSVPYGQHIGVNRRVELASKHGRG